MKKLVILIISFFVLASCSKNKSILKEPKVDERVELLSIAFRLAGSKEYCEKKFPKYIDNIETHFNNYKSHDLIEYIKTELQQKGIGYDAVMKMAISISEPPNMKPLEPLSDKFPEQRWGKQYAKTFLGLLNQFYKDADCETFFKENAEIYKIASNRFDKVYQNLDLEWYQDFYGQKPKGEFRIINGLSNGHSNYGPKIMLSSGKEIIYAIMGTWSVDSLGLPEFPIDNYFPTLLHEFNHSFVNHIVEEYHSELHKSGQIIFNQVQDKMNNQAYASWETMCSETLVRASVIKYLKDHNSNKELIEEELNHNLKNGFLRIDKLVLELERYSNNREEYPTLESFMPEIVEHFKITASGITELKNSAERSRTQKNALQQRL